MWVRLPPGPPRAEPTIEVGFFVNTAKYPLALFDHCRLNWGVLRVGVHLVTKRAVGSLEHGNRRVERGRRDVRVS